MFTASVVVEGEERIADLKCIQAEKTLPITANPILSLGPNLYNGYIFTARLVIPTSWPVKIELADALFSNVLPLEQ